MLNLAVPEAIDAATAQVVTDQAGNASSLALSTLTVGIGTVSPTATLDVQGEIRSSSSGGGGGGGAVRALNPGNAGANVALEWFENVARIRVGGDGVGSASGLDIQTVGNRSLMRLNHDGHVGIGTGSPTATLDVQGEIRSSSSGGRGGAVRALNPGNAGANVALEWFENVARIRVGGDGVGSASGLDIQTVGNRSLMRLNHDGNIEVAGDIVLTGADCAEEFDLDSDALLEPGSVLVISEDEKLRLCTAAYDTKVAGIISGAGTYRPAIVLDRQKSLNIRQPVALSGKAYCRADASYSPIAVGDLLTTSPSPGCAMKAADSRKAFGSVLGKALRPLPNGQSMIPVLIALQ